MAATKLRPLVICVFKNGNKILVNKGQDKVNKKIFYRPLGGGIEFGEHSEAALKREMKEELSAEITELKNLGVLENIFEYEGKPGHEIIIVYDAKFIDQNLYQQKNIKWVEDDGEPGEAVWIDPADVDQEKIPLYPDGLRQLLQNHE